MKSADIKTVINALKNYGMSDTPLIREFESIQSEIENRKRPTVHVPILPEVHILRVDK